MILTVEHNRKPGTTGEMMIYCDAEGLEMLTAQLDILRKHKGHVHLMTPSWSGSELTEEKQFTGHDLINHLCVVLLPDDRPNG